LRWSTTITNGRAQFNNSSNETTFDHHPLLSSDPRTYSAGRGRSDTPVVPDYKKAPVAGVTVKREVVRILVNEGDCGCRRFHFLDLQNQHILDRFPTAVLKDEFGFFLVSKFSEDTNNFSQTFGLFSCGAHAIIAVPNAYIPNITINLLGT
jgi:hypothetical protein